MGPIGSNPSKTATMNQSFLLRSHSRHSGDSMDTVIDMPANANEVTQQALTWPDRARALKVSTSESYIEAGELLKGIKALRKEVDATFDPIIGKAHEAHKE